MKPITYYVEIRVYISEMLNFLKEDPRLGTKENPYKVDMFYDVLSPYACFYGPLRNILVFEANARYVWSVVSADGKELHFSSKNDFPEMVLEMITDQPSDEKWNKVFKKPPKMQPDGKLSLKSHVRSSNVFSLETTGNIDEGGRIKYSFLFEFENRTGKTKYGLVDPYADFYRLPPPPPPPPPPE